MSWYVAVSLCTLLTGDVQEQCDGPFIVNLPRPTKEQCSELKDDYRTLVSDLVHKDAAKEGKRVLRVTTNAECFDQPMVDKFLKQYGNSHLI